MNKEPLAELLNQTTDCTQILSVVVNDITKSFGAIGTAVALAVEAIETEDILAGDNLAKVRELLMVIQDRIEEYLDYRGELLDFIQR